MKYIDSHSHWSDPRFHFTDEGLKHELALCREKQLDFFLQGGVSPDEWQRQIEIHAQFPQNFGLCFGLHPYFVSEHDLEACEGALDQLALLLPQAMALGETGLDFRPHIMKDSQARQIEMFENQIELAKALQKPLVLHLVQAADKALQIFELWGIPERRGFLHAFSGSYETAKKFTDKGFLISVGGAATFAKNRKLQDCLKKLPLEYLLLESDSPDQAPEGWMGSNRSYSIYQVAEKIAELRGCSPFEILEINSSNFKRLFRL